MVKQSIFLVGAVVLVFAVGLVFSNTRVFAHNHEVHGDGVSTQGATLSFEQKEQFILLLKQLVLLLTQYKTLYGEQTPPVSEYVTPTTIEETDNVSVSEDEETEVLTDIRPIKPVLVVEVEAHDGKTHVHVRYTDKPEDMFFIDAALTDEVAVVEAVALRTGLPKDEVQDSLVYLGHH